LNNPNVSIIIPVYNVEKYIHKCINSVLSQTFTDFECILVDDYTPDNSGKICDEYSKIDNRIKVIHKNRNEGLPQARKTGLQYALGSYVIYFDSDDWVEHNIIEELYNLAISYEYDLVHCDYFQYDIKGNKIYEKVPDLNINYIYSVKSSILGRIGGGVINKLIKKSIYEKILFPKESCAEDKYISTQTLFFSKRIGYLGNALYHYRYNHNSLDRNKNTLYKRYIETKNNYNNIYIFLKNKNIGFPEVFEPELSNRNKYNKELNPFLLKNILRKIFRKIVPDSQWENFKIFFRIKK